MKNEFGRLIVGIAFLGLAIFLACNLGGESGSAGGESGADSGDSDLIAEGTAPSWQAPQPDPTTAPGWGTSNGAEAVKPVFDPPPGVATRNNNSTFASNSSPANQPLGQVPKLGDQYRAMSPLQVTGSLQRDNTLVPVQPKPGFTGKLRFGGGVHRVRPGDTLQSIASEYYGSADRYLDIYLANKHVLSNPARLPEGVELRIPE